MKGGEGGVASVSGRRTYRCNMGFKKRYKDEKTSKKFRKK